MKFEHLVQVNDPLMDRNLWLSRDQIWFGLMARAFKPDRFILGLEEAEVIESKRIGDLTILKRRLDFGPFAVSDTVELQEGAFTRTTIHPDSIGGNSIMSISIEEPETGAYWLRFQYDLATDSSTSGSETLTENQYEEARKQAYKASDIDTVKMIRELANTLPNASEQPSG